MIEKILKQLEEEREIASADFEKYVNEIEPELDAKTDDWFHRGLERAKVIIRNVVRLYGKDTNVRSNGWIPCSERLPEVETEVLIHARRKYRDGSFKDIITTAMYEDGTVRENDSSWRWEDVDGEWDEEEDCLIIPKGWWENKHYNPDGILNNAVDDEVIEWMPLPQYQKGE